MPTSALPFPHEPCTRPPRFRKSGAIATQVPFPSKGNSPSGLRTLNLCQRGCQSRQSSALEGMRRASDYRYELPPALVKMRWLTSGLGRNRVRPPADEDKCRDALPGRIARKLIAVAEPATPVSLRDEGCPALGCTLSVESGGVLANVGSRPLWSWWSYADQCYS
jgi:hypothetical protein